jgi:hypothetical protein
MKQMASESRRNSESVVDEIATSKDSQEILDKIKSTLFAKALERIEQKKSEVNNKFLFGKHRDEMKGVKTPYSEYPDQAVKKRQNDMLNSGENPNAAGGPEVDGYPGETPAPAAQGWMNPRGIPQTSYSGDRRKGVGPGAGM